MSTGQILALMVAQTGLLVAAAVVVVTGLGQNDRDRRLARERGGSWAAAKKPNLICAPCSATRFGS